MPLSVKAWNRIRHSTSSWRAVTQLPTCTRFASSHSHDDHHGHEEAYEHRPEGFGTPFWRNTAILSVLAYGTYYFMPSRTGSEGSENAITSYIRDTLTPSDVWKARNEDHLTLSVQSAESKHLTQDARRPLMQRTRYPGKFEDSSPHKLISGDQVDLSDLVIKSDPHRKQPSS